MRAAIAGLAAAWVSVVCLAAQTGGASWPMVNHDAANSRSISDSSISPGNVSQLKPAWVMAAGGNVWATPVVAGGAAYFPDASGNLYKVDAKTGKTIWKHTVSSYDGVKNGASRGGCALADGLLICGDQNGADLFAVDAATGARRWMTQLDANPVAMTTGAPVVAGGEVFAGVTSHEAFKFFADHNYKSSFRGALVAVDVHTGKIVWKTSTMPSAAGWSGGSVMSVPAADAARNRVYFGTDHQYTMPAKVLACLRAAPDDWSAACMPKDARFDSLTAVNMKTGQPEWSFFGGGADTWKLACGQLPDPAYPFKQAVGVAEPVRVCPPVNDYLDWAFAAGSPQLFDVEIGGVSRAVVGMAQKSGVYWLFDAGTGQVIWHTLVGPYSEPGGLTWGAAYDGRRLYVTLTNLDHVPFRMANGNVATGGTWAALDPATGKILWQTEDPQHAADYAAPMVANGVVYVSSLAKTGDQMYALNAATGQILWRFAAGASVASNPSLVNGRLYWGSGFSLFGMGQAGNKLYAFSLDGQ